MQVSAVKHQPVTLDVETELGTVNVTYNRAWVTPKYLKSMQGKPDEDSIPQLLADILIEPFWDVMDGDGPDAKPYGLNGHGKLEAEALKDLPLDFLGEIANALLKRTVPNEPTKSE